MTGLHVKGITVTRYISVGFSFSWSVTLALSAPLVSFRELESARKYSGTQANSSLDIGINYPFLLPCVWGGFLTLSLGLFLLMV